MSKNLFVKLPSGYFMPLLGFGTARLHNPDILRAALRAAVLTGYRHVDASGSFENEKIIGETLKKDILRQTRIRRHDLFVSSKLPRHGYDKRNVEEALRFQLENMMLNYVDMYLLDFGDFKQTNNLVEETWLGLEECVKKGLARSIGFINANQDALRRVAGRRVKPSVNQIEVDASFQNQKSLQFCFDNSLVPVAASPFSAPGSVQVATDNNLIGAKLRSIGACYHKTQAQVILRWLIQQRVAVVLTSSKLGRIVDNFQVWDFQLGDADMEEISQLDESFQQSTNMEQMTVA